MSCEQDPLLRLAAVEARGDDPVQMCTHVCRYTHADTAAAQRIMPTCVCEDVLSEGDPKQMRQ